MTVRNHHIRRIFATNLKQLRKEAGLSQAIAAKKIGLKQNTWSQYESSKSFPEENIIERMVNMLSCAKEDLFKRDDTHDFAILEDSVNRPKEHYSYGAEDKDLLGYLKGLERSNGIDREVANKIREYVVELYKELSDQKDLVIKEKVKLEEFREMMKKQL